MQTELFHPLQRPYTFWISSLSGVVKETQFNDLLKIVGSFSTVEDFWGLQQHFVRPEQISEGAQICLFQNGIKPQWEDEQNQNGGRFIFRVKKNYGNAIWQDLLLSYIGEQSFSNDFICGIVILLDLFFKKVCHLKKGYIQFSVWIKQTTDAQTHKLIKSWIHQMLQLKGQREIDYTAHPKNLINNNCKENNLIKTP